LKTGQPEEIKVEIVNNIVVRSGVDPKFNVLRVLPPESIEYPCFIKDADDFFDMIGCPHLWLKYPRKIKQLSVPDIEFLSGK
jgi:hypothetical protein